MSPTPHPGLLTLRRALIDEPLDEPTSRHLTACDACAERLATLRAEQRRFEAEVPFERFAEGVERAARRLPTRRASSPFRALSALAAGLVAVVGTGLWVRAPSTPVRLKGGADVQLIISAGADRGQRVASADPLVPEPLARTERVRLGVTPASWRFVLVLSVDANGEVTPVYASGTHSLALGGASPEFLPDSLEFTGQGLEHLVIVFSDRALEVDVVADQLRRRYREAGGDVTKLGPLDVPGEQFHRTFLKL